MKVGIFYNSIRNPGKFSNKIMLMDNFAAGVVSCGDRVAEFRDNNLPDQSLDAGFILGYTLETNFRKKIIEHLEDLGIPRIYVDSNILHYARQEHEWHRYSINSVYPTDGIYFFNDLDLSKWEIYSQWHGVSLRPWREHGEHVLIMCQRPNGWNMFGKNQESWVDEMVVKIHSLVPYRPIRIRMHPGDGTRFNQIEKFRKKYGVTVEISSEENIVRDLANCWCAIGYNSTPNVVAAINGIPTYLEDPAHSWAACVGFNDINKIIDPPTPDRTQWIHEIANIHWSNHDVKIGKLWSGIRNYISNH
jgi:hypothetical protein